MLQTLFKNNTTHDFIKIPHDGFSFSGLKRHLHKRGCRKALATGEIWGDHWLDFGGWSLGTGYQIQSFDIEVISFIQAMIWLYRNHSIKGIYQDHHWVASEKMSVDMFLKSTQIYNYIYIICSKPTGCFPWHERLNIKITVTAQGWK